MIFPRIVGLILGLQLVIAFSAGCQTQRASEGKASLKEAATGCLVGPVRIPEGQRVPSSDGCNSCVCDGGGFSCSELACDGGRPNGCVLRPIALRPNQEMPAADGCNTCTCSSRGTLACTEVACAPSEQPAQSCKVGPIQIAHGESLPASDGCNRCGCSDGTLSCTELACGPERRPQGCGVGPVVVGRGASVASSDGCNSCTCSRNDRLSCTEIACADTVGNPRADGSCKVGPLALPNGARFASIDGCNSCTCSDGSLECTELGCPRDSQVPAGCRVGDVVLATGSRTPAADGCNSCVCNGNGRLACTELACQGSDGNLASPLRGCEVGGVVLPFGSRHASTDGCNTCVCDQDSGGFACSELACEGGSRPAGCRVGNVVIRSGQRFPSTDGCNSCVCEASGQISCTEIACANP